MDKITTALFEDPLYVYISLAIAELVVAAIWYERRTRRTAASLAAPLVLAGAVFALETLVVTDREEIIAALQLIAREAETDEGQAMPMDAARRYLDEQVRVDLADGYGGRNLTRQQAIGAGRSVARELAIRRVKLLKLTVEVDNGRAKAHFTTIITFVASELGQSRTSLIWDVHWLRRDAGWRIIRVEEPRTGLEF